MDDTVERFAQLICQQEGVESPQELFKRLKQEIKEEVYEELRKEFFGELTKRQDECHLPMLISGDFPILITPTDENGTPGLPSVSATPPAWISTPGWSSSSETQNE